MLKGLYPDARCTLDFRTCHQLMVAAILAAQCTDERVNKVIAAFAGETAQHFVEFAHHRIE